MARSHLATSSQWPRCCSAQNRFAYVNGLLSIVNGIIGRTTAQDLMVLWALAEVAWTRGPTTQFACDRQRLIVDPVG